MYKYINPTFTVSQKKLILKEFFEVRCGGHSYIPFTWGWRQGVRSPLSFLDYTGRSRPAWDRTLLQKTEAKQSKAFYCPLTMNANLCTDAHI